MKKLSRVCLQLSFACLLVTLIACNKTAPQDGLSGMVKVDGSSTVFPITEAVAEEFQKEHPSVRVTVGISGTGGGFKKFGSGEVDISDASRVIKASEAAHAHKNGIEFIELPVAYDGISVVINPQNDFVDYLTMQELKRIWQPDSTVTTWKDVRAEWPDRPIRLFGPGTDSGTFDYFTKAVVGKEKASRADFTASEDDNVLVQGVSGEKDSLGYFGFAYYLENKSRVKAVPIKKAQVAILPNPSTIEKGTYPISRPVFIYVSNKAAEREEIATFIKYYMNNAPLLVPQVGYISLSKEIYDMVIKRFEARQFGSMYADHEAEKPLKILLAKGPA